ncbi:peroxidase [Escherichia coli]|uniref:peroxidase n=1 Tax=Escherichia coli TaxID=562 RepID=UPI003B99AA63
MSSIPGYGLLFSLFLFLISSDFKAVSAQLNSTFYDDTCPNALSIINSTVVEAIANETRMGASLLRLHFHDCFVNGCDGSILLDDTSTFTGEKGALPNNNSVRGFDVVDTIKSNLESECSQTVSCADILAVAARDSVVALGGPTWTVLLGRRDATNASIDDANSDLPGPSLDLDSLISAFAAKNLNTTDLVALSGGHTIGKARCTTFLNRIENDTNIDSEFKTWLQSGCNSSTVDNLFALDNSTEYVFDNDYYENLVSLKGLLHSDQELYNNASTDSLVESYISSESYFFSDFATAMLKMGNIDPLTGSDGEIRIDCRKVNA